jgi:hypothetical protein
MAHVFNRRTVARWRCRAEHGAHDVHLSVGWVASGEWWVGVTDVRQGWIFASEPAAWALAERIRAQRRDHPGKWVETVPEYEPGVLPPRAAEVPRHPPLTTPDVQTP